MRCFVDVTGPAVYSLLVSWCQRGACGTGKEKGEKKKADIVSKRTDIGTGLCSDSSNATTDGRWNLTARGPECGKQPLLLTQKQPLGGGTERIRYNCGRLRRDMFYSHEIERPPQPQWIHCTSARAISRMTIIIQFRV